MEKIITIDSSRLEELFKTTKDSLSKDESRPILKWIKIEVEKDKMTAISLDGYILSTITIDINNDIEEPYSFFIQPFYIPKTKQGCEITFDCSSTGYVMVIIKPYTSKDTISYKITQPSAEFINWQQAIPKTDKQFEISFNANYLMKILKGFNTGIADKNEVRLCFSKSETGINAVAPMVLKQYTKVGIEKQSIILPIRRFE